MNLSNIYNSLKLKNKDISFEEFESNFNIKNKDITHILKEKTLNDLEISTSLEIKNQSFVERIGIISNLKKIGTGSDREVYILNENFVIKIAKNSRGILQNEEEINSKSKLSDNKINIMPQIFEKGKDYIISERIYPFNNKNEFKNEENNKDIRKFLRRFKKFSSAEVEIFKDPETFSKIKKLFEEKELLFVYEEYIKTNKILWGDWITEKNWGIDKNHKVSLLDGGIFNNEIYNKKQTTLNNKDLINIEKLNEDFFSSLKLNDKIKLNNTPKH